MGEWLIRPMRPEDVSVAERLSDDTFHALDLRTRARALPDPERRTEAHSRGWVLRTLHLIDSDPGGCWVAEDDTGMLGFATSVNRELLWILATYAVRPDQQGRGIGKLLLAAAMHHGRGSLRGMLSSSSDPKAVRRYRLAGFSLHPQMCLRGTVDRSAIPVVDKVREGSAADRDLMDSVDRHTRGAAHGDDHRFLMGQYRFVVSDSSTGSGYAYIDHRGALSLLAATNRRTATRLMWTVLADGPGETTVAHLTPANQWAVDVGIAARLDVHQEGYLALRGMKPPAPYVHNGALL